METATVFTPIICYSLILAIMLHGYSFSYLSNDNLGKSDKIDSEISILWGSSRWSSLSQSISWWRCNLCLFYIITAAEASVCPLGRVLLLVIQPPAVTDPQHSQQAEKWSALWEKYSRWSYSIRKLNIAWWDVRLQHAKKWARAGVKGRQAGENIRMTSAHKYYVS